MCGASRGEAEVVGFSAGETARRNQSVRNSGPGVRIGTGERGLGRGLWRSRIGRLGDPRRLSHLGADSARLDGNSLLLLTEGRRDYDLSVTVGSAHEQAV